MHMKTWNNYYYIYNSTLTVHYGRRQPDSIDLRNVQMKVLPRRKVFWILIL